MKMLRVWCGIVISMFVVAGVRAEITASDLTPIKLKQPATHKPIVLVQNGQARGTIVVLGEGQGKNYTHRWRQSFVEEIQRAIKDATGAELPVSRTPVDGPAIVIGDISAVKVPGVKQEDLRPEGYVVKTTGDKLFIAGSHNVTRGNWRTTHQYDSTVYGMIDFLERFVGVRYYFPAAYGGRFVPPRASLIIKPVWYDDAPHSRMRTGDLCWARGPWNMWGKRLRLGLSYPYRLQCHTPHWNKIPGFFEKHPECFMLGANGKRNPGMLCYGHPKTLEIHLKQIEEKLNAPKDLTPQQRRKRFQGHVVIYGKAITVSPADQGVSCKCEHCRKLYQKDMGRFGNASKLMGTFVAKLAAEVKKRWPGYVVAYLPYLNYTLAPKDMTFPDNVQVELCGMPGFALYKEPKIRQPFQDNIDTWKALTNRKVLTWDYVCWPADRTQAPYQYAHVLQDYYVHNRDKIAGTFMNGGWGSRQHVTGYCCLKLLWHPDFDVDAMMAAYTKNIYGPAAGSLGQILKLQSDRWEKVKWSVPRMTPETVYKESYTPAVLKQMKDLLAKAKEQAGGNELILKRIAFYEQPFKGFCEEAEATHSGTGIPVVTARKVADNPAVDGKLDDDCWDVPEPTTLVAGWNRNQREATFPTKVKVVWTLTGVSFGFHCPEPSPESLVLKSTVRDNVSWFDDNVEIFLDVSTRNSGNFYQYIINANPTVWDARHGNTAWNTKGMQVASHKGKDFWSLEVFLPYAAFEDMVKPHTGVKWYGQFTRHRVSNSKRRDKTNPKEYQRLRFKFGGPSANTGDFGLIKFVE